MGFIRISRLFGKDGVIPVGSTKGNEDFNRRHWVRDIVKGGGKSKQHHKWEQSELEFATLIADYSSPGQLICDPFLGSGAVGAAALRLGRRFLGVEVDEQAYATAKARLSAITRPVLNLGPGPVAAEV
jgi:DNA modification methylase